MARGLKSEHADQGIFFRYRCTDGNGNPTCIVKIHNEGVTNHQVTLSVAYNAAEGHHAGFTDTDIGIQALCGRMSVDDGDMAASVIRMSISDMQDLTSASARQTKMSASGFATMSLCSLGAAAL